MSNPSDETEPTGLGASVKLDIRTEVRSAANGRTLDAITDIFRPISEGLDFLGDKIQLHRQETLLEIAKRAKERIELTEKPVRPIPQKFFLPLLEKASLEDLQDDTLIEMWANLIVTASTEDVQMLGQYINVLANIVPKQVRLLGNMLDNVDDAPLQAGHLIDNYSYLNQTGLPATLDEYSGIDNTEEFANALVSCLNIKGVIIDTINVFLLGEASGGFSMSDPGGQYSDKDFLDYENLIRLGLVDRIEIKRKPLGRFDIDVHYYVLWAHSSRPRLPERAGIAIFMLLTRPAYGL